MTAPLTLRPGSVVRNRYDTRPAQHAFDNNGISNITETSASPGSGVSIDFQAPSSGCVLVAVGGGLRSNGASDQVHLGVEIEQVGGGIVIQPVDHRTEWTNTGVDTTSYQYGSRITVVPAQESGGFDTALAPGILYRATARYYADVGGTGDIFNHDLTVVPLPLGLPWSSSSGLPRPKGLDVPSIAIAESNAVQSNLDTGDELGDPEVSLSFMGPSSGRAIIITSAGIRDNTNGQRVRIAPEVRVDDVNGELVDPPGGGNIWLRRGFSNTGGITTSTYQHGSRLGFLGSESSDQLEPGRVYFARLVMDISGSTADVKSRQLCVIPVP